MRAHWIAWAAWLAVLAWHATPTFAAPAPAPAVISDVPRGKPPPLRPGEKPPAGIDSSGTGFVVAEGQLLTNHHVVDGCQRMVARNANGEKHDAPVTAIDRRRDLALLTVPHGFGPPLTFRDPPAIRRGESVVTYGFPLSGILSSGPTLTTGDVSALSGMHDDPMNIQISAPVQPGNSGGPLLDHEGYVIGVVVAKLNAARIAEITDGDIPQNVNFAVTGTEALAFLREHGAAPAVAHGGGADKGNVAVGDVANPSTVYLQCFK